MDEALKLADYLPLSFKTSSEQEYMAFLWDAFQSNYESKKYAFASLAFHLLYMSFVSFSIWQIRLAREHDFKNALIGFQSESEIKLIEADTPFKYYEKLKESQIFRFMKLIGCTNEHVGEFAKFVKRRNRIAHPSGNVFFNDHITIDKEISEMMLEVANIQRHMRPIILEVYGRFLNESSDVELREYFDPVDELMAALIHRSYISQRDIDVCLGFDIASLGGDPHYGGMCELHDVLKGKYGSEDEVATLL